MRVSAVNKNIKGGWYIDYVKFCQKDLEITIDLRGESSYNRDSLDCAFKGYGDLYEVIVDGVNILNDSAGLTNTQISHLVTQDWEEIVVGLCPIDDSELELDEQGEIFIENEEKACIFINSML